MIHLYKGRQDIEKSNSRIIIAFLGNQITLVESHLDSIFNKVAFRTNVARADRSEYLIFDLLSKTTL